ncbi:MAG: hypothetical protein HOO96_10235 [Polyangiaceae bacterium]|nr:hypothetical protein [Polyangiaceae bacterium]
MLAVSTDMSLPKDVTKVGLYIKVAGRQVFAQEVDVPPTGIVLFPASIAVLAPDDPKQPVKIRAVAYAPGEKAIVLRDMTVTVPPNRVGQLRVPLNFLSVGSGAGNLPLSTASAAILPKDTSGGVRPLDFDAFTGVTNRCGEGQTDVGGECVTLDLSDASAFDVYDPTTIYGGGAAPEKGVKSAGECFDVDCCFADAKTLKVEDDCTVASLGAKTNLALRTTGIGTLTGAGSLIPLDFDAVAKFGEVGVTVLANQRLQLPNAVCRKVLADTPNIERVIDVIGSTRCAPKSKVTPLCGPASATSTNVCTGGVAPDGGPTEGGPDAPFDPKPIELLADNLDAPAGVVATGGDAYVAAAGPAILKVTVRPAQSIFKTTAGNPVGLRYVVRGATTTLFTATGGNGYVVDIGGTAQTRPAVVAGVGAPTFNGLGASGTTGVYIGTSNTFGVVFTENGSGFSTYGGLGQYSLPPATAVLGFGGSTTIGLGDGSIRTCNQPACDGLPPTVLVPAPQAGGHIGAMTSSGTRLYFTWVPDGGGATGAVYRYDPAATPAVAALAQNLDLASAQAIPNGVASDGTNVYYSALGVLYAVPRAGGTPVRVAPKTGSYATGINDVAVDAAYVYWIVRDDQVTKGAVYRRKLE